MRWNNWTPSRRQRQIGRARGSRTLRSLAHQKPERNDISSVSIRNLIETEIRAKLSQPTWRCKAVTLDRRNNHRIRLACRNEDEHQLVKQVAEAYLPRGARVLRDEMYPIKVDNVKRLAVLDELGDNRPEAAAALGNENDITVAKIAWLSKREGPKTYASMVVYLTKASDAIRLLNEGFFYAGDWTQGIPVPQGTKVWQVCQGRSPSS